MKTFCAITDLRSQKGDVLLSKEGGDDSIKISIKTGNSEEEIVGIVDISELKKAINFLWKS
jgi:hypothetical protein